MCFVVYMASAEPCREIPWDETEPALNVKGISKEVPSDPWMTLPRWKSRGLTLPHFYFIGSTEGCGCAFRHLLSDHSGKTWEDTKFVYDEPQLQSYTSNMDQLKHYLTECLQSQETLQIYSCWDHQDYDESPIIRQISLKEVNPDSFALAENGLLIVRP